MSAYVAVVSGGNRGIGREVCRQLADLGHTVILTARSESAAKEAAGQTQAQTRLLHHQLDVTDPVSVITLRDDMLAQFGRVDILINNAAVYLDKTARSPLRDLDPSILEATMKANLIGPLRLIQAFLPGMLDRGYGRIVNVSSDMGRMTELNPAGAYYRLSKLALNGLTRMVAADTASNNVLVNAVSPGWVRTEMGGSAATRSIEEGASGIVWAATLPDGGPSGLLFRDGKELGW
ncbi:MAG: SDR family NAD(P)-dependent oxidoreductase [Dehalococcoidia bacterium]|nr:SDR family NAD(P)-dependent oxidoreductase [Dehalococcoidia bacterium]